ncbi:zf-HC2 domain-containing protein [Nocardia nova]|nr:zf-HC2 domain-containing protein [Nocardia nova]
MELSYGDTLHPTIRTDIPLRTGTDVHRVSHLVDRLLWEGTRSWTGPHKPAETAAAWLVEIAGSHRTQADSSSAYISRSMHLTATTSGAPGSRVVHLTATDAVTGRSYEFTAREKFALATAVAAKFANPTAGPIGPGDARAGRTIRYPDGEALNAELWRTRGSWFRVVEERADGPVEYEVHQDEGLPVLVDPRTGARQRLSDYESANTSGWQAISFDSAGEPLHPVADYVRELRQRRTALWERLGLDSPDDDSRAAWRRLVRMHREVAEVEVAEIDASLAALHSDEPATQAALAEPLLIRRGVATDRLDDLAELDSLAVRYDRAAARLLVPACEELFARELERRPGTVITPHVARFTPEPGEPQEVWVVANEGGHMRAFEAAIQADPSLAPALWRGWRIRYIQLTAGPSGLEDTALDAADVERAYRASFRRELEKHLMAAYLKYRRKAESPEGFTAWLKPLKSDLSTVPDDGNTTTSPMSIQVAVELMRAGIPGWEDARPAAESPGTQQLIPIRAGWLETVVVPVEYREASEWESKAGWRVARPHGSDMADVIAGDFTLFRPPERKLRSTFRSIAQLKRMLEKTLAGTGRLPGLMAYTAPIVLTSAPAPELPTAAAVAHISELPTVEELERHRAEQTGTILRSEFEPWQAHAVQELTATTRAQSPLRDLSVPALRQLRERLAALGPPLRASGLAHRHERMRVELDRLLFEIEAESGASPVAELPPVEAHANAAVDSAVRSALESGSVRDGSTPGRCGIAELTFIRDYFDNTPAEIPDADTAVIIEYTGFHPHELAQYAGGQWAETTLGQITSRITDPDDAAHLALISIQYPGARDDHIDGHVVSLTTDRDGGLRLHELVPGPDGTVTEHDLHGEQARRRHEQLLQQQLQGATFHAITYKADGIPENRIDSKDHRATTDWHRAPAPATRLGRAEQGDDSDANMPGIAGSAQGKPLIPSQPSQESESAETDHDTATEGSTGVRPPQQPTDSPSIGRTLIPGPRQRAAMSTESDPRDDVELMAAVRSGDTEAFGTLFERHIGPVRSYARARFRPSDADDLVSHAFHATLGALRKGSGPESAFRAYVLTVLRNHALSQKLSYTDRITLSDDMTRYDVPEEPVDTEFGRREHALLAQALAAGTLSERARLILTNFTLPAAELARFIDAPSANAANVARHRAVEELRAAYLQAQIPHEPDESCRDTVEQLGAWLRGPLRKRAENRVNTHLRGCSSCRATLELSVALNPGLAVRTHIPAPGRGDGRTEGSAGKPASTASEGVQPNDRTPRRKQGGARRQRRGATARGEESFDPFGGVADDRAPAVLPGQLDNPWLLFADDPRGGDNVSAVRAQREGRPSGRQPAGHVEEALSPAWLRRVHAAITEEQLDADGSRRAHLGRILAHLNKLMPDAPPVTADQRARLETLARAVGRWLHIAHTELGVDLSAGEVAHSVSARQSHLAEATNRYRAAAEALAYHAANLDAAPANTSPWGRNVGLLDGVDITELTQTIEGLAAESARLEADSARAAELQQIRHAWTAAYELWNLAQDTRSPAAGPRVEALISYADATRHWLIALLDRNNGANLLAQEQRTARAVNDYREADHRIRELLRTLEAQPVAASEAATPGPDELPPTGPSEAQTPAAPASAERREPWRDLPPPAPHKEVDLGHAAGVTDVGRRNTNQDDFAIATATINGEQVTLAAVCDGTSGEAIRSDRAAAVGSAAACAILEQEAAAVAAGGIWDPAAVLAKATQAAQDAVLDLISQEFPGCDLPPVSTIVLSLVTPAQVFTECVGDSRAYWIPLDGGPAVQLTTDDSALQRYMDLMGVSAEQAARMPHASTLTRGLGVKYEWREPNPTAHHVTGRGVVALVSDGPIKKIGSPDAIADQVRAQLARTSGNLLGAARGFAEAAVEAGTRDNVTVVLIAGVDRPDRAASLPSAAASSPWSSPTPTESPKAVDPRTLPWTSRQRAGDGHPTMQPSSPGNSHRSAGESTPTPGSTISESFDEGSANQESATTRSAPTSSTADDAQHAAGHHSDHGRESSLPRTRRRMMSAAEFAARLAQAERFGPPVRITPDKWFTQNSFTELLVYPDGLWVVEKNLSSRKQRTAEIVASAFAYAMDAPVPPVIPVDGDDRTVRMPWLPGEVIECTADDPNGIHALEALRGHPDAEQLGLLDLVISNWDRIENVLRDGDHLVGLDHAFAFQRPIDPSSSPFSQSYVSAVDYHRAPDPYEWVANGRSKSELEGYKRNIQALQSLCEDYDCLGWHMGAMALLDKVIAHARDTHVGQDAAEQGSEQASAGLGLSTESARPASETPWRRDRPAAAPASSGNPLSPEEALDLPRKKNRRRAPDPNAYHHRPDDGMPWDPVVPQPDPLLTPPGQRRGRGARPPSLDGVFDGRSEIEFVDPGVDRGNRRGRRGDVPSVWHRFGRDDSTPDAIELSPVLGRALRAAEADAEDVVTYALQPAEALGLDATKLQQRDPEAIARTVQAVRIRQRRRFESVLRRLVADDALTELLDHQDAISELDERVRSLPRHLEAAETYLDEVRTALAIMAVPELFAAAGVSPLIDDDGQIVEAIGYTSDGRVIVASPLRDQHALLDLQVPGFRRQAPKNGVSIEYWHVRIDDQGRLVVETTSGAHPDPERTAYYYRDRDYVWWRKDLADERTFAEKCAEALVSGEIAREHLKGDTGDATMSAGVSIVHYRNGFRHIEKKVRDIDQRDAEKLAAITLADAGSRPAEVLGADEILPGGSELVLLIEYVPGFDASDIFGDFEDAWRDFFHTPTGQRLGRGDTLVHPWDRHERGSKNWRLQLGFIVRPIDNGNAYQDALPPGGFTLHYATVVNGKIEWRKHYTPRAELEAVRERTLTSKAAYDRRDRAEWYQDVIDNLVRIEASAWYNTPADNAEAVLTLTNLRDVLAERLNLPGARNLPHPYDELTPSDWRTVIASKYESLRRFREMGFPADRTARDLDTLDKLTKLLLHAQMRQVTPDALDDNWVIDPDSDTVGQTLTEVYLDGLAVRLADVEAAAQSVRHDAESHMAWVEAFGPESGSQA